MIVFSASQSLPAKSSNTYVSAHRVAHTDIPGSVEVCNYKNDRFWGKLEVDLCFNKDVPDAYTVATRVRVLLLQV